MTNLIYNWDSYEAFRYENWSWNVACGRWFWQPVIKVLVGNFQVPAVDIFVGVVLLSLGASLTVAVLRFKNYINCFLTALLIVSFPQVASSFFYLWIIPVYCCAYLFVTLGVYLTVKLKLGFLISGVLFTLSLGLYQSYICYAIGLYTLYLIYLLIKSPAPPPKKIWALILKILIALAIGFIIYMIVARLMLKVYNTNFTDYHNLSSIGTIYPKRGIIKAYYAFYEFFFKNNPNFGSIPVKIYKILTPVSFVMLVFIIFRHKLYKRNNIFNFVLLIFIICTLPVTLNAIQIFTSASEDPWVHTIMIGSFVLYPIYFIVLLEQFADCVPLINKKTANALHALLCYAVSALIFFLGWQYYITTNLVYLRVLLIHEQSLHMLKDLNTNIKKTTGYTPGMQIYTYGNFPDDMTKSPIEDGLQITGAWENAQHYILNHGAYASRYFLGEQMPRIAYIDDAQRYPILYDMPVYPQEGSIRVTDDGKMIVKFKETN